MSEIPTTGLILTGGGARAAYQIGVLDAVSSIRRHSDAPPGNPSTRTTLPRTAKRAPSSPLSPTGGNSMSANTRAPG